MSEGGSFMSSDWLGAFLIIAILFGGGFGGFGGGNAAALAGYATVQDVNQAVDNQATQTGLRDVLLSSANNNYETARLVSEQTMGLMNQNNTNLINAIQGFNSVSQQIANQTNVLGSKLDQLGFQMESCCCSIKTLIKDNQIADLTNQLNNANNVAVNSAQSQYLLSQMGKWVANAPAATT
ncbi:hypothetical protein [Butyrivibrio sp. AE2032]|uniref:hypothetical protein n=1 Tax=Butyrivibrio sp. AE2032 TaxID=1458463 RepID=UPI000558DE18|nr:hypothetical protein [Butyrivibrio sp. AE2032]